MTADDSRTVRLTFEGHADRSLSVLLFTGVINARDIRARVIASSISPEFAFINAEVVQDLFAVQLAAHKALTYQARGKLATRSLHAELVFNISGSKHIGEALKRFGISDDSQHLLVARFDATPQDLEAVRALVDGQTVPLDELPSLCQEASIIKFYKISEQELQLGGQAMTSAVACRLGAREAA